MRYALIAFVLSLPAAAGAQQTAHGSTPGIAPRQTQAPSRPATPPAPPPQQPRTVAPPIMFPSPPLTAPPAGGLTPPVVFIPGSATQPPRDIFQNGRRDPYRIRRQPFPYGYGSYAPYAVESDTNAPPVTAPAIVGFLRLSGTPAEAQVFVDGYFVGTLGDIELGRPLTIDAGPHRLEIRAAGYQSISVDIRIGPNDTLTYRASLDRLLPAPPPPPRTSTAPAASASSMYLIPNCYLGNVPPRQNRLPAGCDIKNVQVLGNK